MGTDTPAAASGREGFALVEVLVAMVILAVGLLALESMAIGASRSIATANRMTEYTLIASQQLETTLELARAGAAVDGAEVLANGTLVQTDVESAGAPPNTLWTVRVTVTPPSVGVGNRLLTPTTVTGRAFQ